MTSVTELVNSISRSQVEGLKIKSTGYFFFVTFREGACDSSLYLSLYFRKVISEVYFVIPLGMTKLVVAGSVAATMNRDLLFL